MKVLYVTAACLTKNTSANMSHNGYVQGLIENGVDLEIVMSSDSWGENDSKLMQYDNVTYHVFNSVSLKDKIRMKGRTVVSAPQPHTDSHTSGAIKQNFSLKTKVRQTVKKSFYALFPNDPVYPLDSEWLKNASKFKSDHEYDLIISNSSPAASHKLVKDLLKNKSVRTKKWIQIWEDPWYYDLYGGHTEAEKQEETLLISVADEVYYVSPLTLMYQKRYFLEFRDKMNFIPLPAFRFADKPMPHHEKPVFGYFGDYYSHVRNLKPFIDTAKTLGLKAYIIGDTDLNEHSTDQLTILNRMTLVELAKYQDDTDVLVHLCNLSGGQIPGKIYHYSITDRKILFILDGTDEEKNMIKEFFTKYERYYFCNNNKEEIAATIVKLINEKEKPENELTDFYPVNIVKTLLQENT